MKQIFLLLISKEGSKGWTSPPFLNFVDQIKINATQKVNWQRLNTNRCVTIGRRSSLFQNRTFISLSKDEYFELHVTVLPRNSKKLSDWMKATDFFLKTVNMNFGLDQAMLPDCSCSYYLYRFFHIVDSMEIDSIVVTVFFY